jgi:hypothetical protein
VPHYIMMSQKYGCIFTNILYWTMLICFMYWWGAYVVSLETVWLVMAHPFSPHVNIGFVFMAMVDFSLMLITLHHVSHLSYRLICSHIEVDLLGHMI